MGIIKAKQLVHEYIRRDEEGNVESIQTALDHIDLDAVSYTHLDVYKRQIIGSNRKKDNKES